MITDTYTNGITVYTEKRPSATERVSWVGGDTMINKKRTTTEVSYEIRNLSRSVAETGATALASATVNATAQRDTGPLWKIVVTSVTVGAWEADT